MRRNKSKTSIEGVLEEAMASNEAQEVNRFIVREVDECVGREEATVVGREPLATISLD
jgi:hypothetical protein